MFILSTILLVGLMSACDKESSDRLTVKKNWTFTATINATVTTPIGTTNLLPVIQTIEKDDLTEVEAEAYMATVEILIPTPPPLVVGTTTTTYIVTYTKAVRL